MKRSQRLCIFCNCFIKNSKLTRHIEMTQKKEQRVQETLNDSVNMKSHFEKFKVEGINICNMKEAGSKNHPYHTEKRSSSTRSVAWCSQCGKYILKMSFYRHRKISSRKASVPKSKIFVTSINTLEVNQLQDSPNSLKKNILETLPNNLIGEICGKDNTILKLRNVFYYYYY